MKGMIKQVRSAGPEVAIIQLPPAKETLKVCEIAIMNQQLSTTGNSIEGVQYIRIPEYGTLPRHKLIDMEGSILPEACVLIGKTISKDLTVPTNPKAISMPSKNPVQPQKPGLRENRSFGNITQHEDSILLSDITTAGMIIGKQGSTVQQMQRDTGARISKPVQSMVKSARQL